MNNIEFAYFIRKFLNESTFLGGEVGTSLPSSEERRVMARIKARPAIEKKTPVPAPAPATSSKKSPSDPLGNPVKSLGREAHNAHIHTYTDNLAGQGVKTGDRTKIRLARAIDIALRKEADTRLRATSSERSANALYSSPRMATHDSGSSFHQDKKEIAKGIRDEKGKLTSKGKAIYARKDARLFGK